MKQLHQFGIWIDKRKAVLIKSQSDESRIIKKLSSNVEEYHPVGGARSKVAWGPMDSVSESKYLHREKQQLKRYFENIFNQIPKDSELFIFGPAETKISFRKFVEKLSRQKVKVLACENADLMTENQMVAKVREFFNN